MDSGGLAVFDLDGTLTRRDTLAPFMLGYLLRHPWRLPLLLLALPALLRFAFHQDHGALKGALLHSTLGGARRASLDRWAERFVSRLLQQGLYAEALRAIAQHRAHGDRLLLMSASTDLYVPRIAHALGFDECICTQVRWRVDERLDGRLASANCRDEEKRRCLAAVIARDAPAEVSAYGDSATDLPHMQLAQRAYLVNPSSGLAARRSAHVESVQWRLKSEPANI